MKTDRCYNSSEGEFVDFSTLDDWAARDAAKDARIQELEAEISRFQSMTMLDFANYLTHRTLKSIKERTKHE